MKKSYNPEAFAVASLVICVYALLILMLVHCIAAEIKSESVEYHWYFVDGHYYDGYVIRDDGHIWDYDSMFVEPDTPVTIKFCDNGTPDDVTDDNIVSVLCDIPTYR